jgi:hypothetical protein
MLGAFGEVRLALDGFERDGSEVAFHYTQNIATFARAAIALDEGKVEPLLDVLRGMRRSLKTGRAAGAFGGWLAEILTLSGRVDEAEAEVAIALPLTGNAPAYRAHVLAASALVKLRRDDVAGALEASALAMEHAARAVGLNNACSPCLARFEALTAAGHHDEARAVLAAGAHSLSRRAALVGDYGPGYLAHGWRTADLMRLAREHGV